LQANNNALQANKNLEVISPHDVRFTPESRHSA